MKPNNGRHYMNFRVISIGEKFENLWSLHHTLASAKAALRRYLALGHVGCRVEEWVPGTWTSVHTGEGVLKKQFRVIGNIDKCDRLESEHSSLANAEAAKRAYVRATPKCLPNKYRIEGWIPETWTSVDTGEGNEVGNRTEI